MSMPCLVFTCSTCDFRSTSTVVWGRFYYAASPEPVPLERELGWCSACGDLAPVEVLPTADRIGNLRHEIAHDHRKVVDATEAARAGQPWLHKLLRISPTLPRDIEELTWRRDRMLTDLAEEELRLELLKDRKASAKCLLCGAGDCSLLPSSLHPTGQPERPGPPVRIGMQHPNCGGELQVTHSEYRIALSLSARTYDLEGRLLNEHP